MSFEVSVRARFYKFEAKPRREARHLSSWEDLFMARFALYAVLEAKPGKEREVEDFLKSAQPLAEKEPGTLTWYGAKIGPTKFAIFDTFADEKGRDAHINGEIAKALFAKASELFAKEPEINKLEILAEKGSGSGTKQASAR